MFLLLYVCVFVYAQMADSFMALNANCSNVVKTVDFKFDKHVPRDSLDINLIQNL